MLAEAARAVHAAQAGPAVNTAKRPAAAPVGALARPAAGAAQTDFVYRIVVGVVGLAVLAVGILAIPYPGPGWAIVFVGLGILATEFDWARRLLAYAKERYDKVMDWFQRPDMWSCRSSAAFSPR